MSAVCIPFTPITNKPAVHSQLFSICYCDPVTNLPQEQVEKAFSSRYEAFCWAWDFANGRIFTVRPAAKVSA
ncbi:MAG: hypothetical protein J5589_09415 [Firmicutes bacterium]|nr:hypothetical protein [Bacillota bacterium]